MTRCNNHLLIYSPNECKHYCSVVLLNSDWDCVFFWSMAYGRVPVISLQFIAITSAEITHFIIKNIKRKIYETNIDMHSFMGSENITHSGIFIVIYICTHAHIHTHTRTHYFIKQFLGCLLVTSLTSMECVMESLKRSTGFMDHTACY